MSSSNADTSAHSARVQRPVAFTIFGAALMLAGGCFQSGGPDEVMDACRQRPGTQRLAEALDEVREELALESVELFLVTGPATVAPQEAALLSAQRALGVPEGSTAGIHGACDARCGSVSRDLPLIGSMRDLEAVERVDELQEMWSTSVGDERHFTDLLVPDALNYRAVVGDLSEDCWLGLGIAPFVFSR